jgi:tight adherence protein B
MSPTWTLVLTIAACSLLMGSLVVLVYDLSFRYRFLVRERIEEIAGKNKIDANASLFKDLKQFDADATLARTHWRTWLNNLLEQADVRIGMAAFAGASLGAGLALAAVLALASRHWWTAPLGLTAGVFAPCLYVCYKCRMRIRRLTQQLPEAFDAIGRAVQAGQTVPAAFQIVGDDFERPICDEFRRCYEEQNLGMPYDTALRNLASRTGIMELRILVVALLVQSRSGGNLVELLSNLSMMARNRIKLQEKVKALTGEGRMQAVVLTVLPVLAFVCLLVIAPRYASTLLERPWLLIATGLAQLAGTLWIRRIVSFEF